MKHQSSVYSQSLMVWSSLFGLLLENINGYDYTMRFARSIVSLRSCITCGCLRSWWSFIYKVIGALHTALRSLGL
jgi:hypothetical protein